MCILIYVYKEYLFWTAFGLRIMNYQAVCLHIKTNPLKGVKVSWQAGVGSRSTGVGDKVNHRPGQPNQGAGLRWLVYIVHAGHQLTTVGWVPARAASTPLTTPGTGEKCVPLDKVAGDVLWGGMFLFG